MSTILERLTVLLVGDTKKYQGSMTSAMETATTSAKAIDKANAKVAASTKAGSDVAAKATEQTKMTYEEAAKSLGLTADAQGELRNKMSQYASSADVAKMATLGFDKALQKTASHATVVTARLQTASQAIRSVSSGMSRAGRAMTMGITMPLVSMGGLAIKVWADFDHAMTQSLAIMKTTEAQQVAMREQAIRLGGEGLAGPEKLAESYFFLASAGYDAERAIAALPKVASFATAGAFDMAKATDLLTDAQSALGMASSDAAVNMQNMVRLSDTLVQANMVANASVEQFSTALTSKAGASIKFFNKDVEEGVAVLAAYADQGIKAELAGNGLDRMYRLLAKSAESNWKEHEKLGFAVYDANGQMNNTADVVKNLENIMAGMSTQQKISTLDMLGFQAEAQQVIMPLIGASDSIRKYEKSLRSAGGITEEVADKQLKSFINQMKILWNQVKAAGIEIAGMLAPALLWLNGVVKSGLALWGRLSDGMKRVILIAAAIAAAIGPVLMVMGGMVGVVAGVVGGIATLISVGSAVIVPVLAFAAALAGVVVAMVAMAAAAAGVVYWLIGSEGMKTAWTIVLASVMNFAKKAYGFMANFKTNMGILTTWLKSNWMNVFADIGLIFLTFHKNATSNIGNALTTMFRLFSAFQGFVRGILEKVFTVDFLIFLYKGIKMAGQALLKFATNAWSVIKSIFVGGKSKTSMKDFTDQMTNDFNAGKKDFGAAARGIILEGTRSMKGPLDGFRSTASKMPQFVYDTGMDMTEAAADGIKDGAPAVGDAAAKAMQGALDTMNGKGGRPAREHAMTAGQELIKSYTEGIQTFGMAARHIEIYKAALKDNNSEEIRALLLLDRKLTKMETHKRLMDEGASATEANRTDLEKYNDTVADLIRRRKAKTISFETYRRAVTKAHQELKKVQEKSEINIKVNVQGLDALESGTAEAVQALAQYKELRVGGPGGAKPAAPPVVAREEIIAGMRPIPNKQDDQTQLTELLAGIKDNTNPKKQRPIYLAEAKL